MSNAKKCDRCGAFYTLDISSEKDNIGGLCLLDKYGRKAVADMDLCQSCRKELMEWLNMDKQEKEVKLCSNCDHLFTKAGCVNCIDLSNWRKVDE